MKGLTGLGDTRQDRRLGTKGLSVPCELPCRGILGGHSLGGCSLDGLSQVGQLLVSCVCDRGFIHSSQEGFVPFSHIMDGKRPKVSLKSCTTDPAPSLCTIFCHRLEPVCERVCDSCN